LIQSNQEEALTVLNDWNGIWPVKIHAPVILSFSLGELAQPGETLE